MDKKRNEENTPCIHPPDERQEGWPRAVRNVASRILLATLGLFVIYLVWLGVGRGSHDVDIAVVNIEIEAMKDSDELIKARMNESESDIQELQRGQSGNDTADNQHHNDELRHRIK